jgi:hypothetical protein
LRLGELVIDVHQQCQIDAAGGQARIVLGAQHGFVVRQFALSHVLAQLVEHTLLNIDGVDFARGPIGRPGAR